jgi:hypothetical protein
MTTYIKISPKGKAFLKRGGVAAIVAAAIVEKKNEILSEEGLVVNLGDTSVTVKSATSHIEEIVEA